MVMVTTPHWNSKPTSTTLASIMKPPLCKQPSTHGLVHMSNCVIVEHSQCMLSDNNLTINFLGLYYGVHGIPDELGSVPCLMTTMPHEAFLTSKPSTVGPQPFIYSSPAYAHISKSK
jgi:hypothetical protein